MANVERSRVAYTPLTLLGGWVGVLKPIRLESTVWGVLYMPIRLRSFYKVCVSFLARKLFHVSKSRVLIVVVVVPSQLFIALPRFSC